MASVLLKRRAVTLRLVLLSASAALLGLGSGCVDTTPPWEQVTSRGGAVGGGTGGAETSDGTGAGGMAAGTGGGGAVDVGSGGSGGAVDAPIGGGEVIDAGSGGTGGAGGARIDVPLLGTGGIVTTVDGGHDAPLSGTGGRAGVDGASAKDGIGGAGKGGASAAGGTTATGGATGKGGASGTGGATTPDAGPDERPDAQPDMDPLLAGLVVYYRCESANGTELPDDSGNGNGGVLSIGAPLDGGTPPTGASYDFVAGQVANGLALHKAGLGYVKLPSAVFANATDLTIALWVNVTTVQSWSRVLDVGVTATPYQFVNPTTGTTYFNLLPKNGGNNLVFAITTDGFNSEQTLTAPSLAANTWTHVAVVLASGVGGKLYVDGAEAGSNSALTLRPADLGAIDYAYIGKSGFDADPPFDGIIDAVRVYNRALSAAEVQAVYNFTIGL